MRAAVEDVHHRHGQQVGVRAAEVAEQRQVGRAGRGLRHRQARRRGSRSRRACACPACASRSSSVWSTSRCSLASKPTSSGPIVSSTAVDRLAHALAAVALAAVAQLDRLELPGGRSARAPRRGSACRRRARPRPRRWGCRASRGSRGRRRPRCWPQGVLPIDERSRSNPSRDRPRQRSAPPITRRPPLVRSLRPPLVRSLRPPLVDRWPSAVDRCAVGAAVRRSAPSGSTPAATASRTTANSRSPISSPDAAPRRGRPAAARDSIAPASASAGCASGTPSTADVRPFSAVFALPRSLTVRSVSAASPGEDVRVAPDQLRDQVGGDIVDPNGRRGSSSASRAWKSTCSSRSPSSSRSSRFVGLDRLEDLVGLLEQVPRQRRASARRPTGSRPASAAGPSPRRRVRAGHRIAGTGAAGCAPAGALVGNRDEGGGRRPAVDVSDSSGDPTSRSAG